MGRGTWIEARSLASYILSRSALHSSSNHTRQTHSFANDQRKVSPPCIPKCTQTDRPVEWNRLHNPYTLAHHDEPRHTVLPRQLSRRTRHVHRRGVPFRVCEREVSREERSCQCETLSRGFGGGVTRGQVRNSEEVSYSTVACEG